MIKKSHHCGIRESIVYFNYQNSVLDTLSKILFSKWFYGIVPG